MSSAGPSAHLELADKFYGKVCDLGIGERRRAEFSVYIPIGANELVAERMLQLYVAYALHTIGGSSGRHCIVSSLDERGGPEITV